MKIEHLGIWVEDLEKMRAFYMKYFHVTSGSQYVNEKKQFSSYFLSFDSGARIEIMYRPDIAQHIGTKGNVMGYTHFAISVGDIEEVNRLTEMMRLDGVQIVGEPRTTGDGYYESVVSDSEGNLIEITT
jgi:lactoylglutathione lyase